MSIRIPSKLSNKRPKRMGIYEQARIDDDDIVAMYNTTMKAYATAHKNRAKWHRPKGKA